MQVYGLKNCDTTRKALRALKAAGLEPRLVDLREEPLDAALLARVVARFGERAVNRRSTTWRGLSPEARAGAPAQLIAAHPTLLKRPLIVQGEDMTLGWGPAEQAHWLGAPRA